MLIPKNTSVLIRRVPGMPRMPIVTEKESKVEGKTGDTPAEKSNFTAPDSSTINEDNDWDEFGEDLYAIPEAAPGLFSNAVPEAHPTDKADEDSKIKALIDTPAFHWQRQAADGFGPGRGFGRGMAGRGFGMERKTPPQGYVCYRCKVPGHFIQHCPTNGDPTFDVKRVKHPIGIPKSMLMATPDGSYALPSGALAVMKPNEAAFEKEIEGMPSTRSIGDLPPELHCPLCKEVMKDAVLTSKCCFTSFCDKCIRDQIISKSKCVCGATNVLADDLLPNKTLRNTINRILESGNSSAENGGSTILVQDMESTRNPQLKVPSPTLSAASQQELKPSAVVKETPNPSLKEKLDEGKPFVDPQQIPEKPRTAKAADVSEATFDSKSVKELATQGSMPMADVESQQKLAPGEAAKKKKKKKGHMPPNDLWKASQDLAAGSYMMPLGPSAFNPFWNGMQPGMESYTNPFAASMPFMGYGMGPLDMPFGGGIPPDPFAAQGYMMPFAPPQRDLAEFGMGMNGGPRAMSREEFEARKADLRRQRENERRAERSDFPRDREVSSNGDISSMKSVQKPVPPASSGDPRPHHRRQPAQLSPPRQSRELEPPPRPSKRNSGQRDRDRDRDYDNDRYTDRGELRRRHHHKRSESSAAADERKGDASVFSGISLDKKRKVSTATATDLPAGHHKSCSSSSSVKAATVSDRAEYESSDDDDRHFKRKRRRHEPSPDAKHSSGSRDRDRRRR